MANEKEPEPGTRGWRLNEIRKDLKIDRSDLAAALEQTAKQWDIVVGHEWTNTLVSRLILNRQPVSLDDAAVIIKLAEAHRLDGRTWDWFVLGHRPAIVGHKRQPTREPAKRPGGVRDRTGS